MDKLVLTADQIYALAYIMKAKYIDYYYISLSNRRDDNRLWLSDKTNELVSQGVLVEDFSGERSIDPEVEPLLRPLYFSTKESSLELNILGDDEDNFSYRFHFYDNRIVMVKMVDGEFEISQILSQDIRNIVSGLIPSNYSVNSERVDVVIDINDVSRIFVVKHTEMGVRSVVSTFIESERVIYEEDINNCMYTVSKVDFENKVMSILVED